MVSTHPLEFEVIEGFKHDGAPEGGQVIQIWVDGVKGALRYEREKPRSGYYKTCPVEIGGVRVDALWYPGRRVGEQAIGQETLVQHLRRRGFVERGRLEVRAGGAGSYDKMARVEVPPPATSMFTGSFEAYLEDGKVMLIDLYDDTVEFPVDVLLDLLTALGVR